MDRFLDVATKVFAVLLIIITAFLIIKIYQNKYMLVQGQEQTLKNSIYSSKELEIAMGDIDLNSNTITVAVKNKSNKSLDIQIDSLEFNDSYVKVDYSESVNSHTTVESIVDIEKYLGTQHIDSIKVRFMVNNIHNIDLTINITGRDNNE